MSAMRLLSGVMRTLASAQMFGLGDRAGDTVAFIRQVIPTLAGP
jgi:hypothetical protein